ncbi:MAG: hypothetical protein A3C93_04770 [Candidatus Lloydbacteria bacterium RIFCSPHIGHO2_02_FULL_54_17]|uniref:Uncharacterized protein n=1 Tax=Candidatus Lloydbacteria bacterium RIFCSPHIGHO2_02_FULL_54_17 TaxID=1798664 RepID=A0A1G2DHL9_9BACT|nr:MAG: hypothetical protein A2762_01680 [Candidatus Lloydbacteria bacterium RIFCSPHIGHO2_01_FULL_54_11]OGZ12461.1 MAG: hypothetical protein A3C93_04770 [Candidatus Lloydbacteria bacterium RIFCSPHIGHO2_02_FULL_54_17]OGZ14720.1 MAG: hypothetical protein A2948_04450 [Candidatus Lloydbacteria bacterium RIFCSPLOWO2_01_FULL_54_18]OGZ16747.1 MAG: hypothetical protein A3H76_02350 [Candidatus Lloydbacteria bacterium RIFCSPLOWO2_02_FULL_54_12]
MSYQFWGILSGVLGLFSGAWYLVRIFRREVHPHITSWLLWTLIALAMLASYWSAGAKGGDHIWVAVVGLVNPLLITLVAWRVGSWNKPDHLDWACVLLSVTSLLLWWVVQGDKDLSLYSLLLAILADACAVGPMIRACVKDPTIDRPGPWALFGVASAVNMLAISEHTFANYIYPIYMTVGALTIATLLWRGNVRASRNV